VAVRERIASYGSRRFLMAMGAGITATVLQWFEKLDAPGTSYTMIVLGTVAAYITGNVVQRNVEQKTKTTNSSTDQ
jgi:hypothetical protein